MIEKVEVADGGLKAFLGQTLTFFAMNYIYTGKLTAVNAAYVELTDPSIVYETGAFTEKNWKDAQALPNKLYVQLSAVEAFGVVK